MLDWVVILTPVLALGALLLLGFAGCDVVFGLTKITSVEIVVRVPTSLGVTEILYRCDKPDGNSTQSLDDHPVAESTDGADALFRHQFGKVETGAWTARVRVTVNGGTPMQATAQGMFTLDGSDDTVAATFQASVSAGVLTVAFVGAS